MLDQVRPGLRVLGAFALLALGASSAQAATTWYVATSGTDSGSCTSSAPCRTVQWVLSNKTAAGDTVVINPGTYSGNIALSNPTRHSNVTITTTAAVKSALGTFNRGIPTGTDNRPLFTGTIRFSGGVSGATVEYIRMRYSSSPTSGWVYVVGVSSPGNSVRYSELYNATAIAIFTVGPMTFSQNYMHDSGVADGDDPDTHTVFFCRNSGCGGVGGPNATSWSQKTLIEHSTFGGQSDGDQIQFATGDDGSGRDNYVEISHVDFTGKVDEQIIDSKGADYVMVHDSNFRSEPGISAADLSQPIDFVSGDLPSRNWWIYNNVFKPAGGRVYQAINTGHGSGEDYFWIWNNVFHNVQKYAWPTGDQRMIGTWNGMPAHLTFVHNTVVNESITANVNFAYLSAERSDSVIRNNLFYQVFQTSGDSGAIFNGRGSSAAVSHNYFDVASCPSRQCTNGSSAVINSANPLTDITGGNYMPKSGAVVINAGTALQDNGLFTPSLDKAGRQRGSTPDLGALEYSTDGPPPPPPTGGLAAPTNLRVVPD